MQLDKQKKNSPVPAKVSIALATATCSLLGITSTNVAAEGSESGEWEFDSTVMFYSEKDRVSALEPVISARKEFSEDHFLNLKFVFDTLTGSSPNGATATNKEQTFTRPSGNGSYTINANEPPLDDTFQDTRVALSASWETPLTRLTKATFGGNFSKEFDYQSISANALIASDFNQRNTTLSAGLSVASDTISPIGGIPIPFADMAEAGTTQPRGAADDNRTTTDLLFGLTQVVNRRTIMQFNYSLGNSNGYHTDPFKIMTVSDGNTGLNVASILPGSSLDRYVYENRPEDRTKQSFFWQTKHHFNTDIVDVSYRYFWDDWGITSHTVDFHYRWRFMESKSYIEPHVRLYSQTAADFYSHSLTDGQVPTSETQYASADYRLGEFDNLTLGIKYGKVLQSGNEFSFRFEVITTTGDSHPADAIGEQKNQDLFPTIDAIVGQFSYSF